MKKLLVLVLVLSMAAMAGAVTYELRAADGVTAISEVSLAADGGAFTIAVVGLTAETPWTEGIFDNADWWALGGLFDFVPASGATMLAAAGNLGSITYYEGMDGYFLSAGQLGTPSTHDNGDWFIVNCQLWLKVLQQLTG